MKRRDFVKIGAIASVGTALAPLAACNTGNGEAENQENETAIENTTTAFVPFVLPNLPYAYDALNPVIDTETMTIHHDKHHQGYTNKFNAALENGHPWAGMLPMEMFVLLQEDDENIAIRNNGGGYYNHSLFWQCLTPDTEKNKIPADLNDAIVESFGSFDTFKEEFAKAAATQFGSGWAWLSVDDNQKLFVSSTPNQDNPLMKNLVEKSGMPILGIDVWEHAYYLQYQNKRTEYIDNFFSIINWKFVNEKYNEILSV